MSKTTTRALLCVTLMVTIFALPAYAGGKVVVRTAPPAPQTVVENVSGAVFDTGAGIFDAGEGLLTGCLKRTFSFFNPCLDVVKGCTNMVMAPVEKSIDFSEGLFFKPKQTVLVQVPVKVKQVRVPRTRY